MILLANGKLITRDPDGTGYYPDGGVVTDGGKIVAVGTTAELKAQYPQAEFVDARGGVIMPGLINAHTHIYSALARGLSLTAIWIWRLPGPPPRRWSLTPSSRASPPSLTTMPPSARSPAPS